MRKEAVYGPNKNRKIYCRVQKKGELNTNAGLVASADWAYMEALIFRNLTELRDNLSSTLKWAGSHFRAYPP